MEIFRKKTIKNDESKVLNFINEGCRVEGALKSNAFIRIDGTVEGNLDIEECAIIGSKGQIIGDVKTKSLIIYGMVNGNIDSHSLEIKNTGCVNGEIKTTKLNIEFGGIYNGVLIMGKNDS